VVLTGKFQDNVLVIAIMSLFYAAWELFFKNMYYDWLQTEGEFMTFGKVAFGYAIVMMVGYVIAKIIVRRRNIDVQT